MSDNKIKHGALLFEAGGKYSGRTNRNPILADFIKRLGLKTPKTAYIGAASNEDPDYYSFLKKILQASGTGEVFPVKFNRSGIKALQSAKLVFISGGDVEKGMSVLNKTYAPEILNELFAGGTAFAGVSAGSIMMCTNWINWENPDDDSTAGLFPCLGLGNFICDTHDEEDGWRELKTALSHCPDATLGYGIASGCALRVDTDDSIHAYGKNITVFQSHSGSCFGLDDLRT
ncbi:MAG: hypothetical protein A2017_19305 [Lentisphaerae bacterium GWF2_44_16]|nr:MAG: hypothetical protein A2017_19305 [Lentisphaerae bacterium GWF2_44_16]